MRLSRTTLSILAIGSLALGGAAAPTGAAAASGRSASVPAALSAGDRARIEQRLIDFAVPEHLRAGLLEAARHGRAFDAATGAAPTSTDTVVHDGLQYSVSRFDDGSFIATALETPGGGTAVQPDDIQGCSRYTGAGVTEYSHCLVISDTPTLTLQFRASYHRSAAASGIDGISDWDIQAYGGSCALQEFDVVKAGYGSATGPARARLRCFATAVSGIASSYPYLDLVIDGSGARSESNF
ncbi:hypothetical protein QFZ62_000063 [Clavibacter sp. B3I6]|uniref:hypothetical protein n=1 Tax=Clavibacter sp. B3I6 TaxID=3042268 RepID=UPI00277D5D6D|nr:hypothetical protein [Clavibacter sp. B3I6]MDQ0742755.1 hypothetical protein [Clavibacter sp. B3I6]